MEASFVDLVANLGLDFIRQTTNIDQNQLISPIGLQVLINSLLLISQGTNRKLFEQTINDANDFNLHRFIRETLENEAKFEARFTSASSVMFNSNKTLLEPEKIRLLSEYYKTRTANFSSANLNDINQWLANETSQSMQEMISKVDLDDANVLLGNAAHLKSNWLDEFKLSDPMLAKFRFKDGKPIRKIRYASQQLFAEFAEFGRNKYAGISLWKDYSEARNKTAKLDCKLVELRFHHERLAMLIFLPRTRRGLRSLIDSLDGPTIRAARELLVMNFDVKIEIPEFKIETSYDVKSALLKMHNNSSIVQDLLKDVSLNQVKMQQKSRLSIDRFGADWPAWKPTISMQILNFQPKCLDLLADHPFFFAVINTNSGLPYLMGTLSEL